MDPMENEQLERVREWWARYQFYVVIALAMILSAIVGFTWQHGAARDTLEKSGEALFEVRRAAAANNLPAAMTAFAKIDGDALPSVKNLAAFSLVSLQAASGDLESAKELLSDIIDGEADPALRLFAVLRLSEAHINNEDYDAARQLLNDNAPDNPLFAIMFNERLGDADYLAGDLPAAKENYLAAIALAAEHYRDYAPIISAKISALSSKIVETEKNPTKEVDGDSAKDSANGLKNKSSSNGESDNGESGVDKKDSADGLENKSSSNGESGNGESGVDKKDSADGLENKSSSNDESDNGESGVDKKGSADGLENKSSFDVKGDFRSFRDSRSFLTLRRLRGGVKFAPRILGGGKIITIKTLAQSFKPLHTVLESGKIVAAKTNPTTPSAIKEVLESGKIIAVQTNHYCNTPHYFCINDSSPQNNSSLSRARESIAG